MLLQRGQRLDRLDPPSQGRCRCAVGQSGVTGAEPGRQDPTPSRPVTVSSIDGAPRGPGRRDHVREPFGGGAKHGIRLVEEDGPGAAGLAHGLLLGGQEAGEDGAVAVDGAQRCRERCSPLGGKEVRVGREGAKAGE